MRWLSLLLVSLILFVPCVKSDRSEVGNNQYKSKYKLVFLDNFNGTELETTAWSRIDREKYDWCKYISKHDGLYNVSHGRLRLYAIANKGTVPNDTAKYLTGGCVQKDYVQ